jgi:hypothetical protein
MFYILNKMIRSITNPQYHNYFRFKGFSWQKSISIFLISALLLSQIPAMFFVHIHHLPDGSHVVHSHFFPEKSNNTNDDNQHKHQSSEFLVFSGLNIIGFSIPLISSIIFYEYKEQIIDFSEITISDFLSLVFNISLRAPPFVV